MANFDSQLVRKKNNHRGLYQGKAQQVTGVLRLAAGESVALTDLIRMVPLGENARPVRITLSAITVSGAPVLTNDTFSVGVAPLSADTTKRADGTEYAPLTADADALVASMSLATDGMATAIEIGRPSANAKYGQFYVTLTPAGVGAFSVAGGDIDLQCTVELLGEASGPFVYTEYVNQNVNNQT